MYEFIETQLNCITPLHIGCGQDTGIVDLPFIREKSTGLPYVPGSGLRGAVRASLAPDHHNDVVRLLGSDSAHGADQNAGCISVFDAKLVLFPVRCSANIFRWITCPFVLRHYARACGYFGATGAPELHTLPTLSESQFAGAAPDTLLLEEFEFTQAADWSCPVNFKDVEKNQIVLVSDNWFRYFTTHATVITQHNRLTAQKTVANGQLFSVESMPPESVFYGRIGATFERVAGRSGWAPGQAQAKLLELLGGDKASTVLSLGGDESTGLGVTALSWSPNSVAAKRVA